MRTHYISRRDLLSASAGGAAVLLVGCGTAGDTFVPYGAAPAPGAPSLAYSGTVLTAEDGAIYEIDPFDHSVAQLGADGQPAWEAPEGLLNFPTSIAVDSRGGVCVANTGDSNIALFDDAGTPLGEIGGPGSGPGEFGYVRGIAFDESDVLYACDALNHRIQVLGPGGEVIRTFGGLGSGPGEFNSPRALAFDPEGHLHVLDAGNWRVQVFETTGEHIRTYGDYGDGPGAFLMPLDLVIDEHGRVFVSDPATARIVVFEDAGFGPASAILPVNDDGHRVAPMRLAHDGQGGLFLTIGPTAESERGASS